MAEKKKGLNKLRFWRRKEQAPPEEVELTRKPGVLNLHALMLAQEAGLGEKTEQLEVAAEEDDSRVLEGTRLGTVNTNNPTVREGVTKMFHLLLDDLMKLEILTSGVFRHILDYAGKDTLLAIQIKLTEKMETFVVEGASSDDGDLFSQGDIEALLDNLRAHLRQRFEESEVAACLLGLDECIRRMNTIVIGIEKKETVEDGFNVVIRGEVTHLTLDESNEGGDQHDRIAEEEEDQEETGRPNGAAEDRRNN